MPRHKLLERLSSESLPRLTVVGAPAGWGKTTLLREMIGMQAHRRAFAWVSLDAGDNDPVRLWTYVVEALRGVAPELGTRALELLRVPGTSLAEDVLPEIINETEPLGGPVVLVLDDYHVITNRESHDGLAFLVEHLPDSLRVVVASRSDPPLPLARLRARGELLEIRAEELSFSPDETEVFLNDLLGLALEREDLARLHRRTEGWAAGLYLAALSLRDREDARGFIKAFAGNERHIVDYLGTEVLTGQSNEVRRFLLRTSILDRLCAPLCDALTGTAESDKLLREIERSNLFLFPLDMKREWYRYHHLFGELLRHELELAEPKLIPELHRRAAAWFLGAGMVSDGIHHTIVAGDLAEAGELIAEHWAPTLFVAGDRTIDSWLSALPVETVRGDVRLCFARCFVGLSLGRMDEVEEWLAIGETAPLQAPFRDGVTSVQGALACVRAAFLWESGDAGGAMEAGYEAKEAEAGSPWEAIGVAVIGLAHTARGEWGEGRKWMAEYALIGRESGHHINHSSGLSTVSACHAELGEWDAAEQTAEAALEVAVPHGIGEHWCTAHAHLALGLVLEHRGELERAQSALERSVELARRGAGPVSVAWPLVHLARVLAAREDRSGARERLEEARLALAPARDGGIMPRRVDEAERRLVARSPAAVAGEPLSERELAVLRLLPTRLSQREIGRSLYVSVNTVKTHTKSIFRKLGVSNRTEAVERARELGLI